MRVVGNTDNDQHNQSFSRAEKHFIEHMGQDIGGDTKTGSVFSLDNRSFPADRLY